MMDDWKVANYVDPSLGGSWVYKTNKSFPGIHFSQSVDDASKHHMATDDRQYYYYGVTKTYNTPAAANHGLKDAWDDYYKV